MTQSPHSEMAQSIGVPRGQIYARGAILRTTEDDYLKLRHAWSLIASLSRVRGANSIINLTGLERGQPFTDSGQDAPDDDVSPAFHLDALNELGLDHFGGDPATHEIALFNRLTAATFVAHMVLVDRGDTVIGVSASHSHPSVMRAAAHVGAHFVDTTGYEAFAAAMNRSERVSLVVLTRLAVTYDILDLDEIRSVIELAKQEGVPVYVDDAGGARVGPTIYGQPRLLELGADIGSTGLDKYGTVGPRLGMMGGRKDLVSRARARGFEVGLEARPMLYPAVRRSLEQYRPQRVRDLVSAAMAVGDALAVRLGSRVRNNGLIAELPAESTREIALERAGINEAEIVPYEATAALAMLLLERHGLLTVHFAGLPPGTSSTLFKFIPPESLHRCGGPEKIADAVDSSLSDLAELIGAPARIRTLLFGK